MRPTLYCYPKNDLTANLIKIFDTEHKADAWLRKHNQELLSILPNYWSDTVAEAEDRPGEDISGEMTLF